MKDEIKSLVEQLADSLEFSSLIFLGKHDHELGSDGEMIDLILSAHLSSLFNVMKDIVKDNKKSKTLVDNFIDNLIKSIAGSDAITGIKFIYQ